MNIFLHEVNCLSWAAGGGACLSLTHALERMW